MYLLECLFVQTTYTYIHVVLCLHQFSVSHVQILGETEGEGGEGGGAFIQCTGISPLTFGCIYI
jgi:hypothetical protein